MGVRVYNKVGGISVGVLELLLQLQKCLSCVSPLSGNMIILMMGF
jgi:hypothetical protein